MIRFVHAPLKRIAYPSVPNLPTANNTWSILVIDSSNRYATFDDPSHESLHEASLKGVVAFLHRDLYTYSGTALFNKSNNSFELQTLHSAIVDVSPHSIARVFSAIMNQHNAMSPKQFRQELITQATQRLVMSDFVRKNKCKPPYDIITWLSAQYSQDNKKNAWANELLRSEHVADIFMHFVMPDLLDWFDIKQLYRLNWEERQTLFEYIKGDLQLQIPEFFFHVTREFLHTKSEQVRDVEIYCKTPVPSHSVGWFFWPIIKLRDLRDKAPSDRHVIEQIRSLKLSKEQFLSWWMYECIHEDMVKSGNTCHIIRKQRSTEFMVVFECEKDWKQRIYHLFHAIFIACFPSSTNIWRLDGSFQHSVIETLVQNFHAHLVQGKEHTELFLCTDLYWRNAGRILSAFKRVKNNAAFFHEQRQNKIPLDDSVIAPEKLVDLSRRPDILFSEEQQKVLTAMKDSANPMPNMLLVSRAGCGKTAVMSAIVAQDEAMIEVDDALFPGAKKKVKLFARRWLATTTNQLASFLRSTLKQPAYTIAHTCDSFKYSERRFAEVNLLESEEMGLQDELSFGDLIAALSSTPNIQRVLMLGDTFQIPSIAPGNVFADLIKYVKIIEDTPCELFTLTKNFRQSGGSTHVQELENGKLPRFTKIVQKGDSGEEKKSAFMLGLYQGWNTYEYIFNIANEIGWENTHIMSITHKLRRQTNNAIMYMQGWRKNLPKIDQWEYNKKSEEGETQWKKKELKVHHLFVGQKIRFKHNYEVSMIEVDESNPRFMVEPNDDTPTVKLTKNKMSMIVGLFTLNDFSEPMYEEDTTNMTFARAITHGMVLYDCDDMQRKQYCIVLTTALMNYHIGIGYCCTVDSSQGTQRKIVFVLEEPMARRRRTYTAISRGVDAAYVFFRPYKNMKGEPQELSLYGKELRTCFEVSEPERKTTLGLFFVHGLRCRLKNKEGQEVKKKENKKRKKEIQEESVKKQKEETLVCAELTEDELDRALL